MIIIFFLFSLMLFSSNNLLINKNLAYDETKLDLHIFQMNNAYGVVSNTDNFNFVAVGDWDCNSETEDTVNNIIDSIFCLIYAVPIANSYKIKISSICVICCISILNL